MKSVNLFWNMLKIGCIGFGGGSALIPIIQKHIVDEQSTVSQDEYEEDVVVSSITPGALTVKLAGAVGRRIAGGYGMFIGAMGMALPGVVFTVLLLSLMSHLDESMVRQVNFISVGIMAYIACMLTDYVIATMQKAGKYLSSYVGIVAGVCILTCGKTVYRLLGLDGEPWFSLATIEIFGIAFLILGIVVIYRHRTSAKSEKKTSMRAILDAKILRQELGIIFLFFFIVFIPAAFVTEVAVAYTGNGFLSALLSFGGGDAYLTVADGFFVSTGLVSEDVFYSGIVPIVNLLPGSVLCKILSGIGYYIGFQETGSIWGGYLIAIVGLFCSILASCVVVSGVGHLYRSLGEMQVFQLMKQWIRPIVSGLMLNVILSLTYQSRKVGIAQDLEWLPVIIMGVIYVINMFMYYKYKLSNGKLVAVSVILSWGLCNLSVLL